MMMLLCCVLTVVFAVGGAAGTMMYLARSGKLSASASTPAVAAPAKKDAPVTTHPKALEPLLINLADEGGHAYLRLSVGTMIASAWPASEEVQLYAQNVALGWCEFEVVDGTIAVRLTRLG